MKNKVKYFIFSSTCAIYGNPLNIPIGENHPKKPINTYGKTKYIIEEILKDYDKAYGLKYVSLRYFNAAGADLDGEIGENRKLETHLIPLAIDTALGKYSHLKVYGDDFKTKDKTAIRNYIHVKDLSKAHLSSLYYLFERQKSKITIPSSACILNVIFIFTYF